MLGGLPWLALPGWALHVRDLSHILTLLVSASGFDLAPQNSLPSSLTDRFSLSRNQPSLSPLQALSISPILTVSPMEVQSVGSQATEAQLNSGFHNLLAV